MRLSARRWCRMELVPPQVDEARRTLWAALLVFRWAFFAWMLVAATALLLEFERPWQVEALGWFGVIATGAWTLWLTLDRNQERRVTPYIDLAIAVALILMASVVVPERWLNDRPFYAVAYPSNAALLWGAAKGPTGGAFAGAVLSIALVIGRPVNGIALAQKGEIFRLMNGCIYYMAAGVATGVFSMLFARWSAEFQRLADESLRVRERAAKLSERRALERRIHDSVLAGLEVLIRRGSRLVEGTDTVPSGEVSPLIDMTREQYEALRALVLGEPEEMPDGRTSLRGRLDRVVAEVHAVPVTISAASNPTLGMGEAEELAAAVRQALENVVSHANATHAGVFLDAAADDVIVSVRDDGIGFVYDEAGLAASGKAGILKSMKGRVEDLGGTMTIQTLPGRGTEVEFRVPVGGAEREG